jgi:phenylpyruvate tautomerase PptA (4-oxalocrotonate tautomerase family)
MPYFSIETNQTIAPSSQRDLMKKTSAFIAEMLAKPESYVMINIKSELLLSFAGTDDPVAFVRLKSIGLPKENCTEYSEKICGFVERELKVPPNRVFIDFKNLERDMFGWNGKTF